MKVVLAKAEHAAWINANLARCWPSLSQALSVRQCKDAWTGLTIWMLRNPKCRTVEVLEEPAGMAHALLCSKRYADIDAELCYLFVPHQERRQGWGTRAMRWWLRRFRRECPRPPAIGFVHIYATVPERNLPMQLFLRQLGFVCSEPRAGPRGYSFRKDLKL